VFTDHIDGTPTAIKDRQEEVAALYQRVAPPVAEGQFQNTRGGVGSGAALTELPPEAAHDPLLVSIFRRLRDHHFIVT